MVKRHVECALLISMLVHIFSTCYMHVLLSVKSSGTQASNVEGEQMTGDALPSILPIAPTNGKLIVCINIYH